MKKALISIILVGISMLMVGSASFAYFDDIETITGNSLLAGDIDLQLSALDEPLNCQEDDLQLGVIWTIEDWKPGQTTDGRIWFCDVGSNYGGTLYITCDYTADDPACEESDTDCNTGSTQASTDTFASFMQITDMQYYSADDNTLTTLTVSDGSNDNGWSDCQDFKETTLSVPLGDNGANGDYLYMEVKFNENAGNEFQGDKFDLTMTFTLEQIMYP